MRHLRRFAIAAAVLLALLGALAALLTQPMGTGPRTGPEVEVDVARLKATVAKLAVELTPRDYTHSGNLDAIAEWLRIELARSSSEVRVQEWKVEGIGYWNVSASYGPLTDDRLVVGAHYDGFESFAAADDNASGVAALLELGRLLGKNAPKQRVELVVWSLEEPPFFRTPSMGSFVHAKSLADLKVKVRGVISLESIGYFRDEEDTQRFPISALGLLYSTRANYLAVVGNLGQIGLTREVKSAMRSATPLPIFSINAPAAVPGIDFSDHSNYWKFGFPAVMVTDTAFNRNPNYHAKTDTAQTLDYPRLAQATAGIFEAVWRLSR
jgi:hypothetical protein